MKKNYQKNCNDESEKADSRSKDFDDQDANKECRVSGIG